MRNALVRYRIMAYLVGTLLVILVCIGVPMRYLGGDDRVVTWTGIPHGWLYMVFLVMAALLARRARWSIGFTITTLLLGTVPIASFFGERRATARVRAQMRSDPAPS